MYYRFKLYKINLGYIDCLKVVILILRLNVELLVIVNIVIKRHPSTYCLMQSSCFICSDFISKLEP